MPALLPQGHVRSIEPECRCAEDGGRFSSMADPRLLQDPGQPIGLKGAGRLYSLGSPATLFSVGMALQKPSGKEARQLELHAVMKVEKMRRP